mmetsp:Transcript_3402/g.7962  ORF Transcript_3402/g.7962 Transcript_3402/m.7962 type:complete len:877 (-) Transcript_3402:254-2884(-)
MATKNAQELPKREQGVFKTVMKCYEQKQYKKGLRAAEQILKRHPNHGETLAMKGLILNCLKKKVEAVAFAKKGLFANLKSHVCWHVYGLIHRSERRYADAIKSYQNALKYDKENQLILNDLSLLQIQMREHNGFQETRRKILLLKSDKRINWIAYAVGNHLLGDYKKCLHILDTFIKTLDNDKVWDYQESEMFLYRNQVIQESGDKKEALKDLEKIEADARDKQYVWYTKSKLQLELGDSKAAEEGFRKLLDVNNEEASFHTGLQQALGLTPTEDAKGNSTYEEKTVKALADLYDGFRKKWKYCSYAKRFPLVFTSGEEFRKRVDEYMRPKFRKGVPSLFRDLKALYGDKEKVKIVEELVKTYYSNLKEHGRFMESDEKDSETPNVFVWVLYYLASHNEHLGNVSRALELLEEGIAHTPTAIDLYVLKARTLKHVRDFQQAYEVLNFARELDLADRYLNTKCVRYALRAGKVEDAQRIVKLFLRETDTLDSLFEMQAMWYELACGLCHFKKKNYAEALTKLLSVGKHFEDIQEDQFDFHTWCLRKTTLRAYVGMLRYQEEICGHKFFTRAAHAVVNVYLTIYDKPSKAQNGDAAGMDGPDDLSKLTAKERRALKKRQKRAAAKAKKREEAEAKRKEEEREAAKAKEGTANATSEAAKANALKESIPDGAKMAADPDPLGAAAKMVKKLQLNSPKDIDTHLAALEVYSRRGRYLLVLQAIKRAIRIAQESGVTMPPAVHFHMVQLARIMRNDIPKGFPQEKVNPIVAKILETETKDVPGFPKASDDLQKYNDSFLNKHGNTISHCLYAARCRMELGAGASASFDAIWAKLGEKASDLEASVKAFEFVKTLNIPDKLETLRAALEKRHPLTPDFKAPK